METLEKVINVVKFKSDIKELVEKQKFYRNQRKTVHIVGERKMPAWEATYEHQRNSHKLRIMYAAYGLVRGKSFSKTENHFSEENHPLMEYQTEIDKIIATYVVKE